MSEFKAFETCSEMLEQRGYEIVDSDIDNLQITALKTDGCLVCVYFVISDKFDAKNLKEFVSIMYDSEISHSIIIYKNNITSATKKAIEKITELYIEIFAEEDLQYNITKHRLQPEFIKLTTTEEEVFKKNYGTKIPVLKHDKPISRFFGYTKGDIIKIIRKDNTICFRIVK